ncbi:DUF4118 domain-containing protein [Rhizobiaceae bacterium BDR2-2]|uniref:histidine kinase n=1 Tax=Ectorhizobium quercum TaxID=2965071 RepID=A0AAE3STJ1_9HYPH|nr:HWE histidine kinase domain-containing protein [Ectorhizobium quercum]MCX8995738.1 DUF4118 domain-containing protein [Ectorhizobium quercum]
MPKKIGHFRKFPAFKAARGELTRRQEAASYLYSLGIFAIALALRFWLEPVLPPGIPFLTFFPAVVIAGFLFGVRAGMVVAVLSGISAWYFFVAPGEPFFAKGTLTAMALYIIVVATDLFLLSVMMSAYRADLQARRDLERMADEREILMNELDHRLKNVFATMNAVITLSQRHASTSGELANKLKERLNSMARSSLLLRQPGHSGPTTLSAVVRQAISPFCAGDTNRFKLAGPSIAAAGQTSVVLSLILHELGTNAAKYGALSTSRGQVEISWKEVLLSDAPGEPRLEMVWRETRGPAPPSEEPERKGFGSTLISRVIAMLDGEARIEFPASGACVTMTIPMRAIAKPLEESEEAGF